MGALKNDLNETDDQPSGGNSNNYRSSIIASVLVAIVFSVWGGGDERGFIESWRATANGIESVAATHNDSLLNRI
jgi:putative DNA primase/helicase